MHGVVVLHKDFLLWRVIQWGGGNPLSEMFGSLSFKIWVSWMVTGLKICSQEVGSTHSLLFWAKFLLSWNLSTLHPHVLCKHLEDGAWRNWLLPGVVPGSIKGAFSNMWRPDCPHPIYCEAEYLWTPLPMAELPQQNYQRQHLSWALGCIVHILHNARTNGCINTLLRCHFLIKSENRIHDCPAGWTSLIWFGRGSRININAGRDSFNLIFCLGWGEVAF